MQTEDEKVKEKVKANIMNLLSKEYGIERKISFPQRSKWFRQEKQKITALTAA